MSVPLLTKLTLFPISQTLLSGSKFADAGYTAVYDKDEVNFYDSNKIHVNATSILQGYRCPHTGLWSTLTPNHLQHQQRYPHLGLSCGAKSLNTKCVVPSTEEMRLIASSSAREQHSILNVYELPSIQQTIRYLHHQQVSAKTTWMAAIRHGNYNTWPCNRCQRTQAFSPVRRNTTGAHA
eukprot:CCRYP_017081-RA/>CCRYP_017081-RA protein AED:0.42 eAED:0.42 QI:0/-1/0/1/-1/1/1/0/179